MVSLHHGEELVGMMTLASTLPDQFDQEKVEIADEVASQIGISIQHTRMRSSINAERTRLERLIEHLPEGVLLLDERGAVILRNRAAALLGPSVLEIDSEARVTHVRDETLEEFVRAGEGHSREFMVDSLNERVLEVSTRKIDLSGGHGGIIMMIRDATRERRFQQQMNRQERLAAIGQLASGITHDFNNILQSILTYSEFLRRHPSIPDEVKEKVQVITSEAKRGARLVRQILSMGRHSTEAAEEIDLKKKIQELVEILRSVVGDRIELHFRGPLGPCGIIADPTHVDQVLTNLIINARDSMPEGGSIRISLDPLRIRQNRIPPIAGMHPGDWLCLQIRDEGSGIPPEIQERIFEPFFTTKEAGKGTGLGLYQVYGILTRQGGFIDFESRAGEGTTFRLYLPCSGPQGKNGWMEQSDPRD